MKDSNHLTKGILIASLVAAQAAQANIEDPIPYPEAMKMDQRGEFSLIGYSDFQDFRALDTYNEPAFITELVQEGKLPPIEERLPKEPYIFKTDAMADGTGEYGGVLRMVTGNRPQGLNWMAGQHQGFGGVNFTVQECLTRTGPMFQLNAEDQEPLPNLARSWEWSEDGHQLTMSLIEGARWSDGNPFSADDIMFMWEDNVLDPQVPAPLGPDSFGKGATLEKLDQHTIRWTFPSSNQKQYLYNMAAHQFCPGPSHIFKPEHPKYNPEATYDSYINALGPEATPWISMGAWTAVEYKSDEIIMMRRNPYYWKVDEAGNQLPYMHELQFKLSTNADRTVQAMAGTSDIANLENPPLYVETVRQANRSDSPARLDFGPRTVSWEVHLNFAEKYGTTSDREKALRQLNRNPKFRRALAHAVDRSYIGQSLVRGPFTHPFMGGIVPETTYFDENAVVYYPYSATSAKQLLSEIGLKDINGDGYLQWTDGPANGETIEFVISYHNGRPSDGILAESLIAMLSEVGIRLIPQPLRYTSLARQENSGQFDMLIHRSERENLTPDTQLQFLAPLTNQTHRFHRGTVENPINLVDFEKELVAIVEELGVTHEPAKKAELLSEYQRIRTENNYTIGLTVAPGGLVLNKRLRNVTPGTPILAYQWAEGALVRERLWVPKEEQLSEVLPGILPGIN